MGVGEWLRSIGLRQYEPAFHDNDIDGELLPSLRSTILRISPVVIVGHRLKILTAIAQRSPSAVDSSAAADVERLPSAVQPSHAAAERRQLTVLFCDIADQQPYRLVSISKKCALADTTLIGETHRA